jgi:hypothetical protein
LLDVCTEHWARALDVVQRLEFVALQFRNSP